LNDLSQTQSKLKEMEDQRNNGFYDKIKFMEGASWMCDKIIKEL